MEEFSVIKANHFKILTVLTIAASLSLGAYIYTAKEITISIDDDVKEVISYDNTVEELLKAENITLNEGAYINIPLDAKLEDNMNIIIKTPKPYTLIAGDTQREVESVHVKVKDITKRSKIIKTRKKKKIILILNLNDEAVVGGGEIKIFKVREVVEEVQEVIPHENIVNNSNKLDIGVVKVVQEARMA